MLILYEFRLILSFVRINVDILYKYEINAYHKVAIIFMSQKQSWFKLQITRGAELIKVQLITGVYHLIYHQTRPLLHHHGNAQLNMKYNKNVSPRLWLQPHHSYRTGSSRNTHVVPILHALVPSKRVSGKGRIGSTSTDIPSRFVDTSSGGRNR